MRRLVTNAIRFVIVMTILTGVVYVLLVTGIGQLLFPHNSNGSLVFNKGKVIGSELIGQKFDSVTYFWPRPSFISYNPIPSGGSNFGPTSDTLKKLVTEKRRYFAEMNMVPDSVHIPNEMIFASASGLDPHISPAAALMQLDRIVKARKFSEDQRSKVLALIKNLTEERQFHLMGEPRINVFLLNLSLDNIR